MKKASVKFWEDLLYFQHFMQIFAFAPNSDYHHLKGLYFSLQYDIKWAKCWIYINQNGVWCFRFVGGFLESIYVFKTYLIIIQWYALLKFYLLCSHMPCSSAAGMNCHPILRCFLSAVVLIHVSILHILLYYYKWEIEHGLCAGIISPYRRTNHALSHLYHNDQCRPCTLRSISC